ncbi:MAG: alpha/beta hydrolase [Acidobacteria bacterium]|nr:alpha/beta hydrolase [Acidobacteriota bacterium]
MSSRAIHSPRQPRRAGFWAVYLVSLLVAVAVFLAIAGETYEAISRSRDQREFRHWGELVDVGGFRLNLNCLGAGSPTVVLDSGLGLPAAEWSLVEPDVAEFTRVCSYDRAGYGWSNVGPFPRTSAQISHELHNLLKNARVRPPYVLVGHSFGGYNVRVYTREYPDEVAGIVLVEAAHEDEFELLPGQFRAADQKRLRWLHRLQPFVPMLIHLGVERLFLRAEPSYGIASDVLEEMRYLELSSKSFDSMLGELDAMPQSISEVRSSGSVGKRPLLVLSGAKAGQDLPESLDREAFRRIWMGELQSRLALLSIHGGQVLVPDAGRLIPLKQPQAVTAAVKEIVDQIRARY